jgi:uncharacterized RDD family membrane protein YckC
VSYQAYNMPPPVPVDPTDVVGKRIGAWFVDAVIFVVVVFVVMNVFGYGPQVTQVTERTVNDWATTQGLSTTTQSEKQTAGQRYCQDVLGFDESGTDGFDRLCAPVAGDGVVTISHMSRFYALFGILAVVFIVYQGLLGASLGKLAMGLRIVKADGTQAGVGASALRTVLWVVDAITCALPLVGGILLFTTKGHRRVGDMAAGTYVVPASQVGHPVILPGQAGWGTYTAGPYQPMGQPGGYGQPGPPPGGFGQPGAPAGGPPPAPTGAPTPWAPTGPGTGGPFDSTGTDATAGGTADYEADKPIWDEARNAYIQYDSERSEWLEYDDSAKEWKPIST